MEPRVGRSIAQGFRVASRSWAGMGFFIGCWIGVLVIAVLCFLVTRPPAELFEERPALTGPAAAPTVPAQPSGEVGQAPAAVANKPDAAPDLFKQLEAEPAAPTPGASAPAPVVADDSRERARRVVLQWFGHAWPIVLLCILLVVAANLWLTGGQIGYLAGQLSGRGPLSEFWAAGNRAFLPVLGAMALSGAALGVLALVVALLSWVFSLLANAAPRAVVNIVGGLAGLALLGGFVWLVVRAATFWLIAVVVERTGPVAGMKVGWRATRGRFWRILGLAVLVLLLSYGVWLPFRLVEWAGGGVGGGAGAAVALTSNLLGALASIFVGFAVTAALIRFYQDARSAVSSGPMQR